MFQQPSDTSQQAEVLPKVGEPSVGFAAALNSAHPMQSISAPPLNAVSPFGAPLFKTASGESLQAQPLQGSPFSAASNQGTGSPLTVGDVLPQLPPDVVRVGALPPEHPVAISPQVLDAALRSGQAALPIFEIYRVCPALFQSTISPQDPRLIPLPASKLPRLIAASALQPASPAAFAQNGAIPASPFGLAPAAVNPFAGEPTVNYPAPATSSLPPRRNGPPPPLADLPARTEAPPQLSLPGNPSPNTPVFPMSPFAAAGATFAQSEAPAASPFSIRPAEFPPPAGLFAQKPGVLPACCARLPLCGALWKQGPTDRRTCTRYRSTSGSGVQPHTGIPLRHGGYASPAACHQQRGRAHQPRLPSERLHNGGVGL